MKYVDRICEELCDAEEYAYKYVEMKSEKPKWAGYYHTMADDELKHAGMLMEISKVYMDGLPWKSDEMLTEWEKVQRKYTEKTALIKLMLQA